MKPARLCLAGMGFVAAATGLAAHGCAQATPGSVRGSWRVEHILPTRNAACWDQTRAKTLLGTTLNYEPHALFWSGGRQAITDTLARTLSAREFQEESSVAGRPGLVELRDLGIAAASVVELDLQHEDADVTGATTEVPGDMVLLAGPRRIVVSACGVFYSAVRVGREAQGKQ